MKRQALIDASVQPGGRPPAPGPLELVQAFVNTVDREHGPDLLDDLSSWRAWCARRGLVADRDRAEARDVRNALRLLLWTNATAGRLPPALGAEDPVFEGDEAKALTTAVRVLDSVAQAKDLRPTFASPARLVTYHPSAVGAVLAATFMAMADGSWARLKACPGPQCGWAFYDRSANASASWCSMRICGGRAKARAYYLRKRS